MDEGVMSVVPFVADLEISSFVINQINSLKSKTSCHLLTQKKINIDFLWFVPFLISDCINLVVDVFKRRYFEPVNLQILLICIINQ